METTACFDGSVDLRGGRRPLRRIVVRVCEQILGIPLEVEERENSWWCDLDGEARPMLTHRSIGDRLRPVEQREFLFEEASAQRGPPEPERPPPAALTVAELVPEKVPEAPRRENRTMRIQTETMPRYPHPEKAALDARPLPVEPPREKNGARLNVAQFLQLHGMLDGGQQVTRRFTLPKGRYEARCRLWNDPSPF